MSVDEIINRRRSIRKFLPDPVSVTELREILALASQAPNIGNRQFWRFIVITNRDLLRMLGGLVEKRLDEAAYWEGFASQQARLRTMKERAMTFASAPAAILIVRQEYRIPFHEYLVDRGVKSWEADRQFSYPDVQSVSAVIAYLTLLAEERGYGTTWMTDPLIAKKDLQAALETKPGEEIQALLVIGRPDEHPLPKVRRPIDDIIEWRS